jgi:deazaflavin-dependent oxidoreductase (nitroreductase family)
MWKSEHMDQAPIRDGRPPKWLLRIINPLLKAVLRSPLHRLVSKQFILLTVTGRKSGRTYTLPVGRHEWSDGRYVVSAAGAWRHNLRGTTDVRVTLDGRAHDAQAVEEQDPDRRAEVFKTLLERTSPGAVGVKVSKGHSPTVEEIKPLLADRVLAYVQPQD